MTRIASASIILILASLLGGCVKFYGYRDVTISVDDAETGKPIPDAKIVLSYRYMMVANAPEPSSGRTGSDGVVGMRAANFERQQWDASATDYLQLSQITSDGETRLEFHLYRGPAPSVTIIVPNDYRGPLMIDMQKKSGWMQDEIGKRQFKFRASSRGYVNISATPLLMGIDVLSQIHAVFDDNTELPLKYGLSPDAISLRFVTTSGEPGLRTLFVIGTEADVAKIHPKIYDYKDGDPHRMSLNHVNFNAMFDAAAKEQAVPK